MAFKLRSGNTTPFKQMGSSPVKQDKEMSFEEAKAAGLLETANGDQSTTEKETKVKGLKEGISEGVSSTVVDPVVKGLKKEGVIRKEKSESPTLRFFKSINPVRKYKDWKEEQKKLSNEKLTTKRTSTKREFARIISNCS